nr:MAG: hypothetical protein DIU67_08750 [Actinomycetota bacterium]
MGAHLPALVQKRDYILGLVRREEERFRRTLESGHQLLDTELESSTVLSGATAFKLHDTYGFPIELTAEIAAERGITVDLEGFEKEMEAQRERARAAWKGGDTAAAEMLYRDILETHGLTDFRGYEEEQTRGRILAILADGEYTDRAEEGRMVEIFLDRTVFYGESGGQVGDTGVIETETGTVLVGDTKHAVQGLHGHRGQVVKGYVAPGQDAVATIDSPRREAIRKSHTGTHVLHWALRDVLGDHATQAGSLVEPGRLRFDFSHFSAVAPQEMAQIELEINERLVANHEVQTVVTSREEAQQMGALAFFGDKYGEIVRVVKVGDFSTEFCGGTHTRTSGQVGPLILVSEGSIGSNMRRVEALTGMAAYQHLARVRQTLEEAGGLIKAPNPLEVPQRLEALLEKMSGLEEQLDAIKAQRTGSLAEEIARGAAKVGEASLVVASAGEMDPNALRQLALGVRDRLSGPWVVVVGSTFSGKGALVGVASKDLQERGVSAGEILAAGAPALGGGGSRDPELAQAGGPNGANLDAALDAIREEAGRRLSAL